MEIVVNEKSKIVEVWLRHDEKELREQLKSQLTEWKKQGYLPAVFLSGDRELYRQTSDLLCYNRRRCAQLEVQKKKAAM